MPVDPADYPETTRGYPYPTLINAGGADDNAATDVPADLKRLADAVDADVAAVESVAGSASGTVASDLAAHVADSTGVHGIADTSVLVTDARQVIAGTGLTGGGTLAADRTLAVAYGSSAGTAAQGNDARLSDTRTPTDNTVTSAKIVDGAIVDADVNAAAAIAKTKIAGTAVTVADTGTVTDTMLAGSITPSKVTGTAVVAALADAKGDMFAATAADTVARVPVGNNGDLLVASSGATPGLLWRAPSPITATATGVTLDRANPVYTFTSGSVTATLPTASTHTGVRFLIRNAGSGTVTVSGITGLTIPGTGYVDVVSDGSAWVVLEGAYATSAVGLASYRWNQVTSAWRLIAYDSGARDITGSLPSGGVGVSALLIRRTLSTVTLDGWASTKLVDPAAYLTIPAGFLWIPTTRYLGGATPAGAHVGLYCYSTNQLNLPATAGSLSVTWSATDVLPTSLPGTQVTAPV